jgi:photosystem II stability/assembly factor-like uncharacterized protein
MWAGIDDIEINTDDTDEIWLSCKGLKDYPNDNGKGRMLKSTDGGDTWEDYSLGLPPFPCNEIKYMPGSNGLLFLASDIGVFYTDNYQYNNNGGWQCFSVIQTPDSGYVIGGDSYKPGRRFTFVYNETFRNRG